MAKRGRVERRLAETDPDPGQEQLGERSGDAACGGHDAPERNADGDDAHTVAPVGEPADRKTHERVEDREGEPVQQADLRIGDADVPFDRLDQRCG